ALTGRGCKVRNPSLVCAYCIVAVGVAVWNVGYTLQEHIAACLVGMVALHPGQAGVSGRLLPIAVSLAGRWTDILQSPGCRANYAGNAGRWTESLEHGSVSIDRRAL